MTIFIYLYIFQFFIFSLLKGVKKSYVFCFNFDFILLKK